MINLHTSSFRSNSERFCPPSQDIPRYSKGGARTQLDVPYYIPPFSRSRACTTSRRKSMGKEDLDKTPLIKILFDVDELFLLNRRRSFESVPMEKMLSEEYHYLIDKKIQEKISSPEEIRLKELEEIFDKPTPEQDLRMDIMNKQISLYKKMLERLEKIEDNLEKVSQNNVD